MFVLPFMFNDLNKIFGGQFFLKYLVYMLWSTISIWVFNCKGEVNMVISIVCYLIFSNILYKHCNALFYIVYYNFKSVKWYSGQNLQHNMIFRHICQLEIGNITGVSNAPWDWMYRILYTCTRFGTVSDSVICPDCSWQSLKKSLHKGCCILTRHIVMWYAIISSEWINRFGSVS